MTLVLAAFALASATVMGMVAAAVLAYFCWNGAMWLWESNNGHSDSNGTMPTMPRMPGDSQNQAMTSWSNNPMLQVLPHGRGAMGRVPVDPGFVWKDHVIPSHANTSMLQTPFEHQEFEKKRFMSSSHAARVSREEDYDGYESPAPHRGRKPAAMTEVDLSPVAVKMQSKSSRKQPTVSFEDLQRGYAAHFALWYLD